MDNGPVPATAHVDHQLLILGLLVPPVEHSTVCVESSEVRYLAAGGGGSGLEAIGTQPMAAARAKGSQAATEAIPAQNHLYGTVFIENRVISDILQR